MLTCSSIKYILRFAVLSMLSFNCFAQETDNVGWSQLVNTKLQTVCPDNNFNGYDYNFNDKCSYVIKAWNSGALDKVNQHLYIWGGGHHDYYGNELYRINLQNQTILRLTDPGLPADPNAIPAQSELAPFDGSQPNSRHTYDGMAFIDHANKLWAFSGGLSARLPIRDQNTWIFNPQTNRWKIDRSTGDIPQQISGVVSAYHTGDGKIYLHDRAALYSYDYDIDGGKYTKLNEQGSIGLGVNAAIDPISNTMLIIGGGHNVMYELDELRGYPRIELPTTLDGKYITGIDAPGLTFDSRTQRYYAWSGDGRVYYMDEDREWHSLAIQGDPGSQVAAGTFGRFVYNPASDSFFLVNSMQENVYQLKIPTGGDTQAPSIVNDIQINHPYPGKAKITWDASTDNFGVDGYEVYINGELYKNTREPELKIPSLNQGAEYTVSIKAFDSFGNISQMGPVTTFEIPVIAALNNLGDCEIESQLSDRDDVVFCEGWESDTWYKDHEYLEDPIVNDPRLAKDSRVINTKIIDTGCVSGKCLQVNMNEGETSGLSLYWPLLNANQAPDNLYLRYYIKIGDDWTPEMCSSEGEVKGAGGKFPGIADFRTWADPVGQCGNGGARADGENCWSARAIFSACEKDVCDSKPNAITRFGSYIYHTNQQTDTGDAAYWDKHEWGHTGRLTGSCESDPSNMDCGMGEEGIFEPGIWYQVEMQIQMNSEGEDDGIVRGWVNGKLSFQKNNMNFRLPGHDFLHNRLVWLGLYKGGVYGNCNDGKVYLDQMVVSTEAPVGGLTNTTVLPPDINLQVSQTTVNSGESIDIEWQTQNAETCAASDLWQGSVPLSGQARVQIDNAGNVRMDCTGQGGSVARQIAIKLPTTDESPTNLPDTIAQKIAPKAPELLSSSSQSIELKLPEIDTPGLAGYRIFLNDQPLTYTDKTSYTLPLIIAVEQYVFTIAGVYADELISPASAPLVVNINIGTVERTEYSLSPVADSTLNDSTYRNLGHLEDMDIGRISNVIMRFSLDSIPAGYEIEQAILQVTTIAEYSDGNLNVFAINKPWFEDSVTRGFVDNKLNESWDNQNGDWLDKKLTVQGQQPFAQVYVEDDDVASAVELDITSLVNHWLNEQSSNNGLLLTSDDAIFRIASKESLDGSQSPKLKVTLVKSTKPTGLEAQLNNDNSVALSWNYDGLDLDLFEVFLNGTKIAETKNSFFLHTSPSLGVVNQYSVAAKRVEKGLTALSDEVKVIIPAPSNDASNAYVTLYPTADVELNRSTYKNQGGTKDLGVSSNSNVILHFPVQQLAQGIEIEKAELELMTVAEYGNININIYAVGKSWGEYTATRDYAESNINKLWVEQLGDWIGIDGNFMSEKPFSETILYDDNTAGTVTIDITSLVNNWYHNEIQNYGLIIQGTDGAVKFASKESIEHSVIPVLKIYFK